MTTVVIHHRPDGDQIMSDDPSVRVLEIDEAAPNDRVYQRQVRCVTPDELARLIGDSRIGSAEDQRHAALSARINGDRPHIVRVP